jgi:hypothetical protein
MFFRHHRHCRLELRGVGVQKYLYGRSALSRSNVNVPLPSSRVAEKRSTHPHLFLLLLGARGLNLVNLRYSNPSGILPH